MPGGIKIKRISAAKLKSMDSLDLITIIEGMVNQLNSLAEFKVADRILLELESRIINSAFCQSGIEDNLTELAVRLLDEIEPDERWPEESGFTRNTLLLGTIVLLRNRLTLMRNRYLATP
jgi:hypothetical protein